MGEMAPGGSAAVKDAVLLDLGNTLVHYYQRREFPGILREAIGSVQSELARRGLLRVAPEKVWNRVPVEDHEAGDHRVRPLEGRLATQAPPLTGAPRPRPSVSRNSGVRPGRQ